MDNLKHRPTSITSHIKRHWKKATRKVRVRKRSGLRRKPSITGLTRKPSIQTIRRPLVQVSRWFSRPDPCLYRTRLGDIGDVEDEGRDSDEIALRELPARFANAFTQRQLDLCASTSLATLATSFRSSLEQSQRTRTSSWEIVRAEDVPDMTEEESSKPGNQALASDPDDGSLNEVTKAPGSTIAVVYRRHSSELPPFIFTPPITISVAPLDPKLILPPTRPPSPSSSLRQPQPPSEPKRKIQTRFSRDSLLETSTILAEVEGKSEVEKADDSNSEQCSESSILDMEDYTHLTDSWFTAMEEMDHKSSYMLVLSESNLPVFDHFLQGLRGIVWKTVCDVGVTPRCKGTVTEQSV